MIVNKLPSAIPSSSNILAHCLSLIVRLCGDSFCSYHSDSGHWLFPNIIGRGCCGYSSMYGIAANYCVLAVTSILFLTATRFYCVYVHTTQYSYICLCLFDHFVCLSL